jgi:hypothetical protein
MAENAQDEFDVILNKLLQESPPEIAAPPPEQQEIGLASLMSGAKDKAGDLWEWYKRFSYPDLPKDRHAEPERELPVDIVPPAEKPPMPSDKERVLNHLNRKNLSPAAIAGIWGNMDVETGGTFEFDEQQEEGTGYGLFQFELEHRAAYNKYLEDNGLTDRPESQIDYVLDNIYSGIGVDIGHGNRLELQKVFESGNPEEVALEFSNRFENPGKPHMERRIESAKEIFSNITQKNKGGMVQRNPYPYNPRAI